MPSASRQLPSQDGGKVAEVVIAQLEERKTLSGSLVNLADDEI